MQMNRHRLLAALQAAGVPDRWYGINTRDLKSFKFIPESVPVLTQALDGRWYIEYFERGEQRDLAVFDAEEEACAYLYDRVTEQWNHHQPQ
ncbi:hypothetical protein [Kitasatospora sp. NPDC093558]|uniref:hypothetical protein n=1 Tax=Kitasatospora sp. NPDC093558 TaxID=3155201 RepID=UPI00341E3184